jgi:hypothetical protein
LKQSGANTMDYYLFLESKDRKYRPRDRVDDSPLTAEGLGIVPQGDAASCRSVGCSHVSEVDEGYVTIPSHRELADKLVTPSGFHVVSERLRQVFESLRCQESLAYLPIHVLDEDNLPRALYRMVYAAKKYDPLDHSRSSFKYWEHMLPDHEIEDVTHWELDAKKIPALDLFYAEVVSSAYWIATERLRDKVEALGITGCRFEHIWSR